ncbi:MAG: phage holin family protein [Oscillospiraceae bacterium]
MEKTFNYTSVLFAFIGGTIIKALGGADKFLFVLLLFVIIDYITGIIKAIYLKKLSSEISFKGIIKKVFIFVVICIAVALEYLTQIPLREVTICFYIANEGISLMENISEFLPIPQKIKDILLQLRKDKKEQD